MTNEELIKEYVDELYNDDRDKQLKECLDFMVEKGHLVLKQKVVFTYECSGEILGE